MTDQRPFKARGLVAAAWVMAVALAVLASTAVYDSWLADGEATAAQATPTTQALTTTTRPASTSTTLAGGALALDLEEQTTRIVDSLGRIEGMLGAIGGELTSLRILDRIADNLRDIWFDLP